MVIYLSYFRNQFNKLKIMKKAILFFILLVFSAFVFSQSARINEYSCTAPSSSCSINICENQNIDLTAYLDGANIASVVWMEQIMSTFSGPVFSSSEVGGGAITITAPYNPLPGSGYYYRYWLIIYVQGGGIKQAYLDVHLVDPPDALLSITNGSSEICAGEAVTFGASGGSNYEFEINGSIVQSGTNNNYSSNSLNNGDIVTVIVEENGCSATSSPITMTVHSLPDASSVSPSSTCLGDNMDFTYEGLTGTGPWTVSFWDPTHTIQYGTDYNVSSSNGSLSDVPIPYGTPGVHFKIQDTFCPNF